MKIQVFKHEMFGEIRTMMNEKGEIFFVGKDVAMALGYSNTQKAIRDHVEDEDKLTERIVLSGQNRVVFFVNESGLYSLILSSKLPQARAFKRWVTNEVLPQIAKTGGYIPTKDAQGNQLSDLEIVCLALKIQQKTIEEKNRMIEQMEPKAEYCDEVLQSISCFTTTQIAKELNMTVSELTRLLFKHKVMYKQSGQYMLYADYARMGLAKNRTHTRRDVMGELHTSVYLVWTEQGRNFIHQMVNDERVMIPFIYGELNDMEN